MSPISKMSGENITDLKQNNIVDEDDVVDPWNVVSKSETGVNYDKLIRKYYPIF